MITHIGTPKRSTLTRLSEVEWFFLALRWLCGRSECADGRSRGRSGAGREGWGGRVAAPPAAKEEAAEEPHQLHPGADRCPGERCDSKRWLALSFLCKIIGVLERIYLCGIVLFCWFFLHLGTMDLFKILPHSFSYTFHVHYTFCVIFFLILILMLFQTRITFFFCGTQKIRYFEKCLHFLSMQWKSVGF